jgi:hypothetical protein
MTEAEWPEWWHSFNSLMDFLRGPASERKARLFACACCRGFWVAERDSRIERAVDVAERYADGLADTVEVKEARKGAKEASALDRVRRDPIYRACGSLAINEDIHRAAECCAQFAPQAMPCWPEEGAERVFAILRDIFGNPFRPATFSAAWKTDTALPLARQMYESRDFSAMPILADALQDAGCENDDVLNHCRSDGVHVRGCWVCDLVLGKE